MNLVYYTREADKMLRRDLDANAENYYSSEPWIEGYFKSQNLADYYHVSTIVVPKVELQRSEENSASKNQADFVNTMLLYGGFMDKLTPLQASDPMLWTALCHEEYGDYIRNRWSKDGEISLEKRFFATESRSSLLYYNAVSRLWWSGYLTFDEQHGDPWHLTKVLFSAQQIQKDLVDQPFSMSKVVVKGLLNALKRMQEERGGSCTTLFRDCCDSYMNHYGAITVLDMLDSAEVEEIAIKFMQSR